MRTVTGTVLPLVLVYGAVLVLLFAARRPRTTARRRVGSPVRRMLSIAAGDYAMFGSAMAIYCTAQGARAVRCVTTAGAEAGVLAAAAVGLAVIGLLGVERRRRSVLGRAGSRADIGNA
jgi:hypothetical protein